MLLARRTGGVALRQLHSSSKSTSPAVAAARQQCPVQHAAGISVQPKPPAFATDEASLKAARPMSELPGPKGDPLIGVMRDFTSRPGRYHEAFEKWQEHGDIIKLRTFTGTPYEVVSYDVEVNQQLYMADASNPVRPGIPFWKTFREDTGRSLGIVSSNHGMDGEAGLDQWKRHRVVAAELLKPDRVASYVPRVAAVADDFAESLRSAADATEGTVDTEAMQRITLKLGFEAGSSVLLGQNFGLLKPEGGTSRNGAEFFEAVQNMFSVSERMLFREAPLWKWFHTKSRKEVYQHWEDMMRCAQEVIRNRGGEGTIVVSDGAEDFIDHVLKNENLSEEEKTGLLTDMLSGAVDTTSSAMQILLHQAAVLPDVQEKIHADVAAACGDGPITAQALAKMKYTRMCVDEILRMNPVLPVSVRMYAHDIVIRGFRIPAMTTIRIANSVTSKHEGVFADPHEFRPERFEKPHKLARVASATFGMGARMCPAKRFATMEITLGLAAVLRRFKLESKTHTKMPALRSKLLLSPDPADNHIVALVPR